MIRHQLGRRNLTPEQQSYLQGKEYELVKAPHGGERKSKHQSDVLKPVATLAAQHKVGTATIERAAAYATAVDTIAAAGRERTISDTWSGLFDGHLMSIDGVTLK